MKPKKLILAYILLIAAVFAGCGSSQPAGGIENAPASRMEEASNASAHSAENPADTLKAEALSAYRSILKAAPAIAGEHAELADASFGYEQNQEKFGNHYDQFALSDIDQDGIPELIALSTVNFRWTPVSVYTYKGGTAVLLKDPANASAHGTFEQMSTANGAYTTYICEANHIHSVWRGTTPIGEMEENYAYKLEGTALAFAECTAGENEHTVYFSSIAKANTEENLSAMMP